MGSHFSAQGENSSGINADAAEIDHVIDQESRVFWTPRLHEAKRIYLMV